MVNTGELVEVGTYTCTSCGYNIDIEQDIAVPSCPECDGQTFELVTEIV